MVPIHLGTESEFAVVRRFLQEAEFSELNIRSRVKCESLLDLIHLPEVEGSADVITMLIRLFLQHGSFALQETEAYIPEQVLAVFLSLGLLSLDDTGRIYSPTLLTPTESVFCASDRYRMVDGKASLIEDAVYPSSSPPTQTFVRFLPRGKCRRLLEIGSGSGVCAMLAARGYSEQVWASDITSRSTEFAEFNRQLNAIPNMTVVQGDMYAAVEGMTFDRIIAHPPYVPVLKKKWVFYDGGEDGESISRRVIEGLAQHLEPGGRCYCKTLGSDREVPFEQRVRQWLGPSENEFDVLVAQWDEKPVPQFFAELSLAGDNAEQDFKNWLEFATRVKMRTFLNCMIAVQRRESDRPVFTVRRYFSPKSDPASIEWLMTWQTAAMLRDPATTILGSRPRTSQGVQLSFKRRHVADDWVPVEFRIETEYPFANDGVLEQWMPALFSYCTGEVTTADIFARLKAEQLVAEGTSDAAFANMIAAFVARGFLEIESFSLPGARG